MEYTIRNYVERWRGNMIIIGFSKTLRTLCILILIVSTENRGIVTINKMYQQSRTQGIK